MSTSSYSTRSKKGKSREVSVPVPAQTKSKGMLGKHRLSSDNVSLELCCLIEGEAIPFIVTVPGNKIIAYFKELVHEEGIGVTDPPILAKALVLQKVTTSYSPT